jgi:hypothetical protein
MIDILKLISTAATASGGGGGGPMDMLTSLFKPGQGGGGGQPSAPSPAPMPNLLPQQPMQQGIDPERLRRTIAARSTLGFRSI